MNKVSQRNKKSNNRVYSLIILLAFLGFIIYFSVTFIKQEIKISQLRNDAQSAQKKVEEQVQYSKELKESMKAENEIKRVEETAREKLGYLKKDEILFVDSSEK